MRLLMVAPPGAGKGTQASRLADHYGIAHLSSGDLLRHEVAARTEIGTQAAACLAQGDLVPDSLVRALLGPHILDAAARGGYVLDGFPRNRRQAEEAYEVAARLSGIELQAVVHLQVGRTELLRRLSARADTSGRVDDDEVVIHHRLEVYESETVPLLEFYSGRGLVVDINGEQSVERVFHATVEAVDSLRAGLR